MEGMIMRGNTGLPKKINKWGIHHRFLQTRFPPFPPYFNQKRIILQMLCLELEILQKGHMERTLPSLSRNLESSKRYRLCRNKNGNSTQFDKSAPYRSSQLRLNNRSQSSLNMNGSSFAFCQVQELCLKDNKWIIFDQSFKPQLPSCPRPMTTFSRMGRNKQSGVRTGRGNATTSSSFLPSKANKERLLTTKENLRPYFVDKTQQSPKKQSGIQKINISKVTFKGDKSRVHTENKSNSNQHCLELPKSKSKQKHSPSKSSLSVQGLSSRGSPIKKSLNKSQSKGNVLSSKSIKSAKSLKQVNKKDHLLTQVSQAISITSMNHKFHLIEYLDPTNLIDPNYMMPPMSHNPYDDFPEWGQYDLKEPAVLVQKPQMSGSAGGNESPKTSTEQNYDFLRKLSLPLELIEKAQKQNKARFVNSSRRGSSSEKSVKDGRSKKQLDEVVSKGQQKHDSMRQRIITTRYSEKPLEPLDSKKKEFVETPASKILSHHSHQTSDPTFNLKEMFTAKSNITLIEIDKSNQTALFPSNTKTPIYVKANPDSCSLYRNHQLVNIINILLKVQPALIRQLFANSSQHLYDVLLYDKGQRVMVLVDGVFPFDGNYYPLFGSVQQFIWFGVLVKAIAKVKGSYEKVSQLGFQDVFALLSKHQLVDATDSVMRHSDPINQLSSMVRLAKHRQTFVVVSLGEQFYKLQKLIYKKSATEQNEEYQQLLMAKATRAMSREMKERKQINMKSLSKYIDAKKQQISLMRSLSNTSLQLMGTQGLRTVTFKEFFGLGFRIWISQQFLNELPQ